MAQTQRANVTDTPDLAKKVQEWVDTLARAHYEDLSNGPVYKYNPYIKKEEVLPLTKVAEDVTVFKWSADQRTENAKRAQSGKVMKPYVIPPPGWRSEFKSKFAKYIGENPPPNWEDWKEVLAFLIHQRREASAKTWHKKMLMNHRRVIEKLPFHELAEQYSHLLRFQPEPMVIPLSEDIDYWRNRVQKYLDVKAKKLMFKITLECFDSFTLDDQQCLRISRIHQKESGEKMRIDEFDLEISKLFMQSKLCTPEEVFDYEKHIKEIAS